MHLHSSAHKRLVSLYRSLLVRMQCNALLHARGEHGRRAPRVEALEARMMLSGQPNLPPVITVPSPQSVAEDNVLTFATAGSNALSDSDSDGGSGTERLSLATTHGTLSLTTAAGLSFSAGTGFGDTSMTFDGTLASINAAIDGLQFQPNHNYFGPAGISLSADDLGNTGSNGPQTASGSVSITVAPVADTPSVSNASTPQNVQTASGLVISRNAADGAEVGYFKITNITNGTLFQNDGTTAITADTFITYAQGHAGLKFTPAANSNANGGFAVQASVTNDNSGLGGATVNAVITVTNAPVNHLPPSQTVNEDTPLVLSTANGNVISLTDPLLGVLGLDSVTLSATDGVLTLATTADLLLTSGNGTNNASMSFTGTLSQINAALNGMTFAPTANYNGSASIQISTTDATNILTGPLTTNSTLAVTVTAVNDAPAMTVPSAQTTAEDTPVIFSSGHANQISVSDIDANEAAEQVTLTANNGTLTLATVAELSFSSGSGTGDATMVFTGTLASLNAALEGMVFTPGVHFTGTAAINFTIDDLGNSGAGGAKSASGSININIAAQGHSVTVDTTSDVVDGNTSSITALLASKGADGRISLREAITASNNTSGPNQISFNIPDTDSRHFYYRNDGIAGSLTSVAATTLGDASIADFDPDYPYVAHSWFSIDLDPSLAELVVTSPVTIDGYTQPGAAQNTLDVGDNASLRIELTTSGSNNNPGFNIQSSGSVIRGLAINHFSFAGIIIQSGADGNNIQGNFVGIDVTGTLAAGNGDDGVQIRSSNNTFGGSVPADRNVSSANANRGIGFFTSSGTADSNLVENNYLGVDAIGMHALGNAVQGISAYDVSNSRFIGNVISANALEGIWFRTSTATGNIVQGNVIGADALGTSPLGNGSDGILLNSQANANTIGGIAPGEGNVIAWNTGDGVDVAAAKQVTIRGNDIFANQKLGIDLNNDGPTANTGSTSASFPNIRMNSAVVVTASISTGVLTLSGYVGSAASQSAFANAEVDLYTSDNDASGRGEGKSYLGTMSADANGNLAGSINAAGLSAGQTITATATDSAGNTSEFAANVSVLATNQPPSITAPSAQTTADDAPLTFSTAGGNPIVGGDADSGGAAEQLTLSSAGGTLTLATMAGLTLTAGTGTNDTNVVFTGTIAAINAALDGMRFTPALPTSGGGGISISINDLGNSGVGGSKTASGSISIAISATARTPSVTNATTRENQQSAGGLVITRNSSDSLAVNWLKITNITGGTLYQSDGATTIADGQFITMNQGTAGLKFTPALNSGASGGFDVQASTSSSDAGLGGSVVSATITVTPGPSVTVTSAALNYMEKQGLTAIDPGLVLGDASSPTLSGATVRLNGYVQAEDGLNFVSQNGITGSWDSTTGILTLSGTATLAQYQAALRSIRYQDTSAAPDTSARSAEVVISDGVSSSAPVARSIIVNSVDDPPTLLLPTPRTIAEDTPVVLSASVGASITVSDLDAGSADLRVTLAASHGLITLSGTRDLVFQAGDGTGDATMIFTGTLVALDHAINNLTFTPDLNYNGPASIQVTANDLGNTGGGGPLSSFNVLAIDVTAVNDPPAIAVPAAQLTPEDTPLDFSSAAGNAMTVSDIDAQGGDEQLTLTAVGGTLTLGSVSGLTFISGSGAGDAGMTFIGTLAAINAAMNGMAFSPDPNYFGSAGISLTLVDQGNTGAGGPLSFSSSVGIDVTPVADTPTVTDAATVENVQTASGLVIARNPADGAEVGWFQITNILGGALFLADGTTPISDGGFVSAAEGAAGLRFTPIADSIASGSFDVQASTAPNDSGLGGGVASATITVDPSQVLPLTTLGIADVVVDENAGPTTIPLAGLFSDPANPNAPLSYTIADNSNPALFQTAYIDTVLGELVLPYAMNATGVAHVVIRAADGNGSVDAPFNVTVNAVTGPGNPPDAAPVLVTLGTLVTSLTRPSVITTATLAATDADSAPQSIVYTLSSTPRQGILQVGAAPLRVGGTFTQADLNAGRVSYRPVSVTATEDRFTFALTDDLGAGGGTFTVAIRVSALPPAPIFLEVRSTISSAPLNAVGGDVPALEVQSKSSGSAGSPSSEALEDTTEDEHKDPVPQLLPTPPRSIAPLAPTAPARGARDDIAEFHSAPQPAPAHDAAPADNEDDERRRSGEFSMPGNHGDGVVPQALGQFQLRHDSAKELKSIAPGSAMLREWDELREERLGVDQKLHVFAGAASFVSIGVSVVYFLWAVRAGSILSSLLSSMPAWKLVDPLPILDHMSGAALVRRRDDDEGLESMLSGAGA